MRKSPEKWIGKAGLYSICQWCREEALIPNGAGSLFVYGLLVCTGNPDAG